MATEIQQGQYATGLNSAQAASYAAIASQKHEVGTPIYNKMSVLVDRLVDLALEDLQVTKAEQPLPDPTGTDTVQ